MGMVIVGPCGRAPIGSGGWIPFSPGRAVTVGAGGWGVSVFGSSAIVLLLLVIVG